MKRYGFGHALVLVLAGVIVDHVPRRYLPATFVAWYNGQLDNWEVR